MFHPVSKPFIADARFDTAKHGHVAFRLGVIRSMLLAEGENPSPQQMCEYMGISLNTYYRARKTLVSLGWWE